MDKEIAIAREDLVARAEEHRTQSTDLETISRLFADLGVEVLGTAEAHKFADSPHLVGQVLRAHVIFQETDLAGNTTTTRTDQAGWENELSEASQKPRACFVLELLGPNGPVSVYCNSNLCIKIFPKMGAGKLRYRDWEERTDVGHPELVPFVQAINTWAKALNGAGLSILYTGMVASRNAGREYRNFMVTWIPQEVFVRFGAEMVARAVAPGKDWLDQKVDDDI